MADIITVKMQLLEGKKLQMLAKLILDIRKINYNKDFV